MRDALAQAPALQKLRDQERDTGFGRALLEDLYQVRIVNRSVQPCLQIEALLSGYWVCGRRVRVGLQRRGPGAPASGARMRRRGSEAGKRHGDLKV
jgi:hypothetical protein